MICKNNSYELCQAVNTAVIITLISFNCIKHSDLVVLCMNLMRDYAKHN